MKKSKKYFEAILFAFVLAAFSPQAEATKLYCRASNQDHLENLFEDGWVILDINAERDVVLSYFSKYDNGEIDFVHQALYSFESVKKGRGRMAEKNVYALKEVTVGKSLYDGGIPKLYLDEGLFQEYDATNKAILGNFYFSGHGYSYDSNYCRFSTKQ